MTTENTTPESFIKTRVNAGIGEIILDRPKALNALDQSMIDDLTQVLRAWGDDDDIELVVVTSGSDRAFCAGGDIKAIRGNAVAGDTAPIERYFHSEYALNQLIAEYPKPYLAIIDGAAMGGGLGISVHGEIRVVTERAVLAMPETAIGFFPDIGASYFLSRLPAGVGMWLGLTGSRLTGAQAVKVGLATHYVPTSALPGLLRAVREGGDWVAALQAAAQSVPDTLPLDDIAKYFDESSPAAIVGGLSGASGDWPTDTYAQFGTLSPTSVAVTAALITAGASSPLDRCLEREYQAAVKITATHDFIEGVRAVLVDKDRDPHFEPATLAAVDPATVAAIVGD